MTGRTRDGEKVLVSFSATTKWIVGVGTLCFVAGLGYLARAAIETRDGVKAIQIEMPTMQADIEDHEHRIRGLEQR